MGDKNPIRTLRDYFKPSHEGYRNTIKLRRGKCGTYSIRHHPFEIDLAGGGKLRNKNTDESWEIIENLALYDHEGWNATEEFRGEERSEKTDVTTGDDFEKPTKIETKLPVKEAEKEDEAENEPNIKAEKEEKNEVVKAMENQIGQSSGVNGERSIEGSEVSLVELYLEALEMEALVDDMDVDNG
ncbi:hypothetical protein Tco_1252524 [Tanacetum coccineum]